MPRRERSDLLLQLREARDFLRASARGYDEGYESEAKRLAVTLRVLLHDTKNSHSLLGLLGLLGLKGGLPYVDTAEEYHPGNLMPTFALVAVQLMVGQGARYVPLDPEGLAGTYPATRYEEWWEGQVVLKSDGEVWSRRKLVLHLANKEGGAHVDPHLTPAFDKLANRNGLGFRYFEDDHEEAAAGDPIAASVRQIATEMQLTFDRARLGLM